MKFNSQPITTPKVLAKLAVWLDASNLVRMCRPSKLIKLPGGLEYLLASSKSFMPLGILFMLLDGS
jgi:hypothetical protein